MYKTDYLRKGSFTTKIAHIGCSFCRNSYLIPINKQNQWSFMGKA